MCDWSVDDQRLFKKKIAAPTTPPPERMTSTMIMSTFIRFRRWSGCKFGNINLLIRRVMRKPDLTVPRLFKQKIVSATGNLDPMSDDHQRACPVPD
jgi:hypothetical protein